MKKFLISLFVFGMMSFGAAQTAMVTGSLVGDNTLSAGVELGSWPMGPVEVLFGGSTDFEDLYVYVGPRVTLVNLDEVSLYSALRLGAVNSLDNVFSVPDSYMAQLGFGGLDEHSMLEVGGFVQTSTFDSYEFGATVSVGFGFGR